MKVLIQRSECLKRSPFNKYRLLLTTPFFKDPWSCTNLAWLFPLALGPSTPKAPAKRLLPSALGVMKLIFVLVWGSCMTFTVINCRILSWVHQYHSCRHDVLKVKASCSDVNKHLAPPTQVSRGSSTSGKQTVNNAKMAEPLPKIHRVLSVLLLLKGYSETDQNRSWLKIFKSRLALIH